MATSIYRVLVAVDFGEASSAALRVAEPIARQENAKLTMLHAAASGAPPYFTPDQVQTLDRERRTDRTATEWELTAFARAAGVTVPVTPLVVEGEPGEVILRVAPLRNLLVMGTHGRRGPSRWWLGSVAERVVRATPVPVMVVWRAPADVTSACSRVVWCRDDRDDAARAWAEHLAAAFGGTSVAAPSLDALDVHGRAATMAVASAAADDPGMDRIIEFLRSNARPILFIPQPASQPVSSGGRI
jgi:nucleotide-binding universal stress UspA family protein